MTRGQKYLEYEKLFFDYFIVEGENLPGRNLPVGVVTFDNGKSKLAEVGDGPINLASYLLFLLSKWVLTKREEEENLLEEKMLLGLQCLDRLSKRPLREAQKSFPGCEFSYEPGFFLRDDINTSMVEEFCTEKIVSAYGMFYEGRDEDPCFSSFVSQDQIWNLLPILSLLCEFPVQKKIQDLSQCLLLNMLGYVIKNKHTLYNPYLSQMHHFWTYLPSMNTKKVLPWNRKEDRERHFRNHVKVKRGANNWYYAYGFRKTYNRFSRKKANRFKSFLYSLIYYPLTFAAEKIWFPAMHSIFGTKIKNNSYHCLAVSGEVWFGGMKNFDKHLKKCFEKGEFLNLYFIRMFKSNDLKSIDTTILKSYLDEYPEPKTDGYIECPLDYMTAYNFYKCIID